MMKLKLYLSVHSARWSSENEGWISNDISAGPIFLWFSGRQAGRQTGGGDVLTRRHIGLRPDLSIHLSEMVVVCHHKESYIIEISFEQYRLVRYRFSA